MQQIKVECDACGGEGYVIPEEYVCNACHGKRTKKDASVFEVVIEKGMKRGDTVTITGEGDQVPGIELSGDIVILLALKPHAFFQRRGRHLFFDYTISLEQALCGWELPIEHLDGRKIILKTRPGQVFDPQKIWVVDREGMPVKGTGGTEKGGLIITLKVTFPDKLSAAQTAKIKESLGTPDPLPEIEAGKEVPCSAVEYVEAPDPEDDDEMGHGGQQQVQCAHQ